MTCVWRSRLLLVLIGGLLALAGCASSPVGAQAPAPTIVDARMPEPASPSVAAVYLEISATGRDDVLLAARTDAAERVQLHETVIDGSGTARMEPRPEGLAVPADGGLALEPGGPHLMLHGPSVQQAGERFELTLEFDGGGEVTTEVEVVAGHGGDHATGGDERAP